MKNFQVVTNDQRKEYNPTVSHPLQAFEWGEFRKKTGLTVVREAEIDKKVLSSGFQLTLHPIPHSRWNIGYLPKGSFPTKNLVNELREVGKQHNCIFIQLEPDIENIEMGNSILPSELHPSAHPLFTKYTFVLDISQSEEELLKNMHPKTRYNIRVAQKYGVVVSEDNSEKAFKEYLSLTEETTKRQGFYAHSKKYHTLMWETLKSDKNSRNELIAHLLTAKYKGETLVSWIFFSFKDTLYYPYGASSSKHRETMASTLMMFEAIKFGKKLGLTQFDMWGALGENPHPKDPWFGFHRFKKGFGARHVEFIGSYDLILNPSLYLLYKAADKLRWGYLSIKRRFS